MRNYLAPLLSRVATAASTPLVPADYLDVLAPLRGSSLRARVLDVRRVTSDSVVIELAPGAGWAGHVPGQFLRIGVDIDGVRHWRSYSITSRPDQPHLEIAVKEQGLVSGHLNRHLQAGQIVELDQAAGDFHTPSHQPARALFVTAGSGITPVIGMLRSSVWDDAVVVHSSRDRAGVMFGDELRSMAARGLIRLHERATADEGRLQPQDLTALVPDLEFRQTWVCGPGDLIDGVIDLYETNGWQPPHHERFRSTALVTGNGGAVRFARTQADVEVSGEVSLLEAGESAGVLLPSGCRMGVCYGCVTPLASGSVRDLRDGNVTTVVEEPVLIQTCINSPAGPCTLDA